MTQEIYLRSLSELRRSQNKLEKEIGIKISHIGKNVFIEGEAQNEFLGLSILEAINLGFSAEKALLLKDENMILHILDIKTITKRKDLRTVRGRVIGSLGKTKENIENLSDCLISIHDNNIGIIGEIGCIDEAIIALTSIVQGSKQGNIYARLERKKKERRLKPSDSFKNELKLKK